MYLCLNLLIPVCQSHQIIVWFQLLAVDFFQGLSALVLNAGREMEEPFDRRHLKNCFTSCNVNILLTPQTNAPTRYPFKPHITLFLLVSWLQYPERFQYCPENSNKIQS